MQINITGLHIPLIYVFIKNKPICMCVCVSLSLCAREINSEHCVLYLNSVSQFHISNLTFIYRNNIVCCTRWYSEACE